MSVFRYTLLLGIALLCACSVERHLPSNKTLYDGATVQVENPVEDNTLPRKLRSSLSPLPNRKVLGFPLRAWLRLRADSTANFVTKALGKSFGEDPVYYEQQNTQTMRSLLINRAENMGYFGARASFDTSSSKGRMRVSYRVRVPRPYRYDSMALDIRQASLRNFFADRQDKTLIKKGDIYRLADLRAERQRLDDALADHGYYYFESGDLEFLADTSSGDREVDLLLRLKQGTPPAHLRPQYIQQITIRDNVDEAAREADTLRYEGIRLITDQFPLRPEVITDALLPRPGDAFAERERQVSLQRISNLNTFRFVNMQYQELSDSSLAIDLLLYPRKRRTIQGELGLAYRNNGYLGPEFTVNYQNRNLFRGAELLSIEGNVGLNIGTGGQQENLYPFYGVYGLGAELAIPRLIIPFVGPTTADYRSTNTDIGLRVEAEDLRLRLDAFAPEIEALQLNALQEELQADSLATTRLTFYKASASFGYRWQKREAIRHGLTPLVFSYQDLQTSRPETNQLLGELSVLNEENATLYGLEKIFLFSPEYIFDYDSRRRIEKTHNIFFRERISMNAGRFNRTPSAEREDRGGGGSYYLQTESDLRHYWRLSAKTTLASRLRANLTLPFTRETTIPYFDLYSIGGANSLRAFAPRTLGPGTVAPDGSDRLLAGFGTILLEGSTELRYELSPYLETALFTDVGNICCVLMPMGSRPAPLI